MTREERERLIERYAKGPDEVATALAGFPAGQLSAHPLPGKWSAAEIVHHLSDSESISGTRLRRLIAEEHPVIYGYNQDDYAHLLRYNDREIAPALENFRTVRLVTTQLLRTLTDADWQRRGWHSETGLYTADTWLGIYAAHAHNHAAQIRRLREALVGAK